MSNHRTPSPGSTRYTRASSPHPTCNTTASSCTARNWRVQLSKRRVRTATDGARRALIVVVSQSYSMRATAAFAYWSAKIEWGASASSALAYSVASMVCGGPWRSTRTRSTGPSLFGLGGGAVLRAFTSGLRALQCGPEPSRLADGCLDRARLPPQLTDGLAVIDLGFGAHHAHRREAEFGILAGDPGSQAPQRTQRVQHRDRNRASRWRHAGLVGGDPHDLLQRDHPFGDQVPLTDAPALGGQDHGPGGIVDADDFQLDAVHHERQLAEDRAGDEGTVRSAAPVAAAVGGGDAQRDGGQPGVGH